MPILLKLRFTGNFIKPETKRGLKPVMYILLFIFGIIVVKKIIEVLK